MDVVAFAALPPSEMRYSHVLLKELVHHIPAGQCDSCFFLLQLQFCFHVLLKELVHYIPAGQSNSWLHVSQHLRLAGMCGRVPIATHLSCCGPVELTVKPVAYSCCEPCLPACLRPAADVPAMYSGLAAQLAPGGVAVTITR